MPKKVPIIPLWSQPSPLCHCSFSFGFLACHIRELIHCVVFCVGVFQLAQFFFFFETENDAHLFIQW